MGNFIVTNIAGLFLKLLTFSKHNLQAFKSYSDINRKQNNMQIHVC